MGVGALQFQGLRKWNLFSEFVAKLCVSENMDMADYFRERELTASAGPDAL